MRARIPFSLTLITLLFACDDRPAALAPEGASADYSPVYASAATASEIAKLRRLVAPFHNFHAAVAAGWSVQFTPCLEAPGLGAMGFHYGNPAFVGDGGAVELLEPELLLYEPRKNGKLRFVGVEYIVPFTDHPATEAPPTLLGQEFELVPDAGLWGLHIYVGRQNPSGIFSAWNPKVSCKYAGLQGATTGHGLHCIANPLVEQLLPCSIRRRYQSEGPKLGKAGGRTVVRTDLLACATGGQDQADAEGHLSRSHPHILPCG